MVQGKSVRPRISIITPSYNQGKYIERTIQSVLSQDIPDLEYVVYDGGSTDETIDSLCRYEGQLRWVSEKDRGQAHAVNKGITTTTGEIIGWLNSDDIYYPKALETVVSFLAEQPDIDMVYGDADHIDENDDAIEPYYTEEWNYERLKDVCYLCQPAVFLRRRVVQAHGLLDETLRYCMDYEYWLRVGSQVKFAYLRRRLAGSRMYPDNKTLGSRVPVHREIVEMTKNRLGQPPDRWILNYAHAVVETLGFHRSSGLAFAVAVTAVSWYASLRWNRRLSSEIVRTTASWIGDSARFTVREVLTR